MNNGAHGFWDESRMGRGTFFKDLHRLMYGKSINNVSTDIN